MAAADHWSPDCKTRLQPDIYGNVSGAKHVFFTSDFELHMCHLLFLAVAKMDTAAGGPEKPAAAKPGLPSYHSSYILSFGNLWWCPAVVKAIVEQYFCLSFLSFHSRVLRFCQGSSFERDTG
jgi:hypothetical protein